MGGTRFAGLESANCPLGRHFRYHEVQRLLQP